MSKRDFPIQVVTLARHTKKGIRYMLVAFDGKVVQQWPILTKRGWPMPLHREPTQAEIDAFADFVANPIFMKYPRVPSDVWSGSQEPDKPDEVEE